MSPTVQNLSCHWLVDPDGNGTSFQNPVGMNGTQCTVGNATAAAPDNVFDSKVIIPLYVTIFLLSVVGNVMVLSTLFQNKRMRTVTNVYLVNLAIADLLLGVLCMPFTLIGQVLRNFVFGGFMCRLIPYSQAVSVSVAVWTLVAISLERYFAICSPLKSRRWQTQFHAYKMIFFVWVASLFWSSPVLYVSSLRAMKIKGTFKCREDWPSPQSERAFNWFLDGVLLIIPLIIMTLAYSLIVSKLWKGLQKEIEHNNTFQQVSYNTVEMKETAKKNGTLLNGSLGQQRFLHTNVKLISNSRDKLRNSNVKEKGYSVKLWLSKGMKQVSFHKASDRKYTYNQTKATLVAKNETLYTSEEQTMQQTIIDSQYSEEYLDDNSCKRFPIRSNYMDKSIEAKKKVIRMLFVIVLEFFICWAPIHILNTCYLYFPDAVYNFVGPTGISLVQLMAYISSCCNPITYCFMNRKFRQAFLSIFCSNRLCCCFQGEEGPLEKQATLINNGKLKIVNHSDGSINESTIYPGRASTLGRSEVLVLEGEERV